MSKESVLKDFCCWGQEETSATFILSNEGAGEILKAILGEAFSFKYEEPKDEHAKLLYPILREKVIGRIRYYRNKSKGGKASVEAKKNASSSTDMPTDAPTTETSTNTYEKPRKKNTKYPVQDKGIGNENMCDNQEVIPDKS